MEICIDGPSYIFGDNKYILSNALIPDSVLQKKSNSIGYQFVREGSAAGEWLLAHIASNDNIADMLTKPLSEEKHKHFISQILHHFA